MKLMQLPHISKIRYYFNLAKFSIFALLSFVIVLVSHQGLFAPQNPDPEKFRKVLAQKQVLVADLLKRVAVELKKTSPSKYTSAATQFLELEKLQSNGYFIFVYEKDSLNYWSDNSVSISNKYSIKQLGGKVAILGNGTYVVETLRQDSFLLVGLILIKHKYPNTNEYLSNDFESDFGLPSSMEISNFRLSYGVDINDSDGNYMFSLSKKDETNSYDDWKHYFILFLFFLGVVFILLFFSQLIKLKNWLWTPLLVLSILIRWLMIHYKWPQEIMALTIFRPENFSDNLIAPSLGDFLLNVLIIYLFSHRFLIPIKATLLAKIQPIWKKIAAIGFVVIGLTLIFGLSLIIQYSIESLITNSKIPFDIYKVQNLKIYHLIGVFIISLIFATYRNITNIFVDYFSKIIKFKDFNIVYSLYSVVFILFNYYFYFKFGYYYIVHSIILVFIMSLIFFRNKWGGIYIQTAVVAVFATFTVLIFYKTLETQDKTAGKKFAMELMNERDVVAEQLLKDIDDQIQRDDEIKIFLDDYANGRNSDQVQLHDVMQKKYFSGYLEKYQLEVTICGTSNYFDEKNKIDNCQGYFQNQILQQGGKKVNEINYFFIDSQNGSTSYLGTIKCASPTDSSHVTLFVKLTSGGPNEEYNFPQVLLEKNPYDQIARREYSYAKYKDNLLVSNVGDYIYSSTPDDMGAKDYGISYLKLNSYNHVIFRADPINTIIVSKSSRGIVDIFISFSYIFVFFNIIYGLAWLIQVPGGLRQFVFDYKTKIQIWMITILVVSFFSVGGGTIYYTIQQFELRINKNINERTLSVHNYFDQRFNDKTIFTQKTQGNNYYAFTDTLKKISKIFFADINLYATNGDLIASSRPEIFYKNFMGFKINSIAYKQLSLNKRRMFLHDEKIGNFGFTSAYIPILNAQHEVMMYMNLPYISKPEMLKNERSVLIISVINLYVFLFLLTLAVAVFIANTITRPLRLLGEKFKSIELGKRNQQIDYKSKDEVGTLVVQYNRMIEELARNVELLARSEREMAWREMAKQIAHEIKNPLTPMKLSVQYLLRVMHQKDQDFEKRFEGVSKTLIENIDNLAKIANEFSNFAKMPTSICENVDLVEKVESTVRLFDNEENITFNVELHHNKSVIVWVDKEQISRVFINLVKNAIQSIPEERNPLINIEVLTDDKKIIVVIEDNGCGIANDMRSKIFVPNFTTKNSGTGLGLAIVKNIIENANGKIWFETEIDKGTRFYVELPILQKIQSENDVL